MKMEDRRAASDSQRVSKIAGKPPEARKRQGRIPLQASDGAQPCPYLDFRFLPPEM